MIITIYYKVAFQTRQEVMYLSENQHQRTEQYNLLSKNQVSAQDDKWCCPGAYLHPPQLYPPSPLAIRDVSVMTKNISQHILVATYSQQLAS